MPSEPTARCGVCKRGWSGVVSAHCSVCHQHFSTVKNFDAHKPNRRGCGDPRTMTRTKKDGTSVPIFKASEGSFGTTWVGYSDNPLYAEAAS